MLLLSCFLQACGADGDRRSVDGDGSRKVSNPHYQHFTILTINVPVVYMVRYKVVLRGDYP